MRAHAGIIVLAGVMFAGCATDQRSDVDAYRKVYEPTGEPPTFAHGDALELRTALRLAAVHNEQLAIQGERWIQALADRQRAAAALQPTVELFGRSTLRENTGNAGVSQTDVGVNGQYRLLTGMTDLRNVNAADATIASRRWLILDLRESLLVQTARAYYDALRAERLTDVLENSVQTQSQLQADAKARNEAGLTRALDVSQIEAQLSRTRAQLIVAQRQAAEARSVLSLLTNAPTSAARLIDEYTLPPTLPTAEDMLLLATDHRQDVQSARADADAARQLVDAAIGEYAPALTLNLDYFLLRSPDSELPSISSILEVRLPVWSAGRIAAQVRGAWSVFRERVLTYQLRQREARRDVEVAHVRATSAVQLMQELDTQVRAAREAFELAEANYQAGFGTNLERVIAQDQLLTAELQAVSAQFDTKTAYLELLRAAGVLSHAVLDTPLPTVPQYDEPTSPFLDRTSTPAPATVDTSAPNNNGELPR